jgi:uncharacterized protein (TIGR02246 family)
MLHTNIGSLALMLATGADATIPAAARRAIAETNATWLDAVKRQDAAAIAAICGQDAIFVTVAGEMVQGRAAMERFERDRFEQTGRVLNGEIHDDGLTRAGQFVYEWGHVTMRVLRHDGMTAAMTGRFLTVWAPDSTGRWRITRNLSLP